MVHNLIGLHQHQPTYKTLILAERHFIILILCDNFDHAVGQTIFFDFVTHWLGPSGPRPNLKPPFVHIRLLFSQERFKISSQGDMTLSQNVNCDLQTDLFANGGWIW